ncbi:hypothetical protein P7228_12925 [Altererythrobacter arenosus]|uniref:Lipoprotein n=1 Tax=Altererythrobacter arenosus TaxID=3032592 RepID=A0ABY8FPE5_9SPHN|nr:hypothetical protein [Altererythrobacter sp. CAU 1644]WFL76887.1 hypothetical protein P7228_12925 [Altererythrobacter sp. CAU 1644]
MSRIIAATLVTVSTAACATKSEEVAVPGCTEMACVAIGEAATLNELLVATPLEVLEDSRCPAEADCIWEGRVLLKTRLDLGHETITVQLDSGEPLRINGGYLRLAEVAPYASTQWSPIAPGHYRFGFAFTPDGPTTAPPG